MDKHEPNKYSATINLDEDEWNDNEDIELGGDESELFLRDEYVRPSHNDILPYRANSPPVKRQTNDRLSRNRSQFGRVHTPLLGNDDCEIEMIGTDGNQRSAAPPVSTNYVYQQPNFDQFAGNLSPQGLSSIIASFVIILIIVCVTILPIILPQSKSIEDEDILLNNNNNVIKSNISKAQSQIEHADVRCKCICPPLQQDAQKDNQRRLYVGNTIPNQCNCNNIVQPHLTDTKISLKDFCARCECRYQSRNTATIKRNVIFFIVILAGLGLYMFVQYILKYFRINRRNLPRQFRWLSHQLTDSD